MYSSKIDRIVFAAFYIYFTIFYLIPFIYITLYNNKGFINLYNYEYTVLPITLIFIFPLLIYLFDLFLPRFNFYKISIKQDLSKFFLVIFLLLLVSSIIFSTNYGLDFRQNTSQTLTNSGIFAIITFALKSIGRAYIFVVFLKFISGHELCFIQKTSVIIIVSSYLLTIVAASDIFVIIAGILVLIPNLRHFLKSKISITNIIVFLIIIIITVIGAVFVGNANKIGFETALDLFLNKDSWSFILERTIKRISTFYVSTFSNHEALMNDYFYTLDTLSGSLNNLAFRFFHLFGFDYEVNSEFWSINRLNYTLLFQDTSNNVTGASPGIVAAIYQFPIFPLGLIFISIYSITILRSVSLLTNNKKNINLLTAFIIFTFILPFFETPLDLINVISPFFIYLFTFFFLKKII